MYAHEFLGMLADQGEPAPGSSFISAAMQPFMPAIQETILEATDPAVKQAVEVMKPAMKEALADYAPTGIALGAILFIGGLFTSLAVVNRWRKELKKK